MTTETPVRRPPSRQASSLPRHSVPRKRLVPALAGLWTLTLLQLRSHIVRIVVTALVLGGAVVAMASQFGDLYPGEAARTAYSHTVGISGVSILFNGRGYGLTTLGGIAAFEMGIMTLTVSPIVIALFAVALTRREEEAGRTDLVTAAPVGRLSPLVTALIVVGVTLALEGLVLAGGLIALDYPPQGSWLYALALCLHQALWAGLAAVAAQLWQAARAAATWTLLAIGVCFVLRGTLDQSTDVRWVTPMQWQVETRPFGDVQWQAYALLAGVTGILVILAAWLATHRDAGAGVFAARSGPARAGRQVETATGLQLRLLTGGFAGWLVGTAGIGLVLGLMAQEMRDIIDENPQLVESFLASGIDPADMLPTMTLALTSIFAAVFAGSEVQRLAAEEGSGRTGVVLATPVRRSTWWLTALLVTGTAAVVIAAVGGLCSGLGTWISGAAGEGVVGQHVGAAMALTPAVLVMVAIAGLAAAIRPALAPIGWLPVTWAGVVAFLAELLDLPEWARDLSPVYLIGTVPAEAPDRTATIALCAAALVLALASAITFRRRDLVRG